MRIVRDERRRSSLDEVERVVFNGRRLEGRKRVIFFFVFLLKKKKKKTSPCSRPLSVLCHLQTWTPREITEDREIAPEEEATTTSSSSSTSSSSNSR